MSCHVMSCHVVVTHQWYAVVGVLIVNVKNVVTSSVSDVADVDFLHSQFQFPTRTLSLIEGIGLGGVKGVMMGGGG